MEMLLTVGLALTSAILGVLSFEVGVAKARWEEGNKED